MKKDYQKVLKQLTLIFLSNPVCFNGQIYQKKGELVTSPSSGYETSSNIFLYALYIIWASLMMKQFYSYSKNYISKFMKVNSWHHKLFHFHLSFWIWKVPKERKKLQKFEYLENEKSFLDEIKKTFFIVFEGLSFGET